MTKRKTNSDGTFGGLLVMVCIAATVMFAASVSHGTEIKHTERLASYSHVTEVAPIPQRKPPVPMPDIQLLESALENTNGVRVVANYPLPVPTLTGVAP